MYNFRHFQKRSKLIFGLLKASTQKCWHSVLIIYCHNPLLTTNKTTSNFSSLLYWHFIAYVKLIYDPAVSFLLVVPASACACLSSDVWVGCHWYLMGKELLHTGPVSVFASAFQFHLFALFFFLHDQVCCASLRHPCLSKHIRKCNKKTKCSRLTSKEPFCSQIIDPIQKWQRFNILLSTFKLVLLALYLS